MATGPALDAAQRHHIRGERVCVCAFVVCRVCAVGKEDDRSRAASSGMPLARFSQARRYVPASPRALLILSLLGLCFMDCHAMNPDMLHLDVARHLNTSVQLISLLRFA